MTNKEAIEILNQIYCDWRTEDEQEAIELAIQALVQENMGDFTIVNKGEPVEEYYGLESFHITKEEILALIDGKVLYAPFNGFEYAITIELAESEERR